GEPHADRRVIGGHLAHPSGPLSAARPAHLARRRAGARFGRGLGALAGAARTKPARPARTAPPPRTRPGSSLSAVARTAGQPQPATAAISGMGNRRLPTGYTDQPGGGSPRFAAL